MRNIWLTMVVVLTLVAATIGGTLAAFSDYEVSQKNYFKMGEMDLVVSDSDGAVYNGAVVPPVFKVDAGWPDCSKDRWFDLHNAGQNEQEAPDVYLHFKNLTCDFTDCKEAGIYGYIKIVDKTIVKTTADDPAGIAINEPAWVAIFGGIAGENAEGKAVTVDGIGDAAICLLSRYITVEIYYSVQYDSASATRPKTWDEVPADDRDQLDLSAFDANGDGKVQLSELICKQLLIGPLKGCWVRFVDVTMRATDVNESVFGKDFFAAGSDWEDWPTNAMQAQKVQFDLGFELLQ